MPRKLASSGITQCKVCKTIKDDVALAKRINHSRMWVPGGETLLNIHHDYEGKFIYKSLVNHAKKHQAPTQAKLKQARAQVKLAEIKGQAAVAEVRATRHYSDDLAELKAIGMEMVRTGDSKVSAAVLAKLIDIEVKIEEKAKDRSFEMAKMVAHFASGAGRFDHPDRVNPVEGEVID